MDNQDVLWEVCVRADVKTLEVFSRSTLWEKMKSFISTQHFWYLRTQYVTGKQLVFRLPEGGCWKRVYWNLPLTVQNPLNGSVLADELSVSVLLELGYDPTIDNGIALENACKHNMISGVKVLLADGRVDPSRNWSEMLIFSCIDNGGKPEIVKLLLEDRRADPRMYGNWCLRRTCELGYSEIVKLLLEDGRADARVGRRSALLHPHAAGHAEVLRLLDAHQEA